MKLIYHPVVSTLLVTGLLLCNGEWSSNRPVAYTVYNVNKTWNEAKDICYAHNSTMLSMANDTIWQLWISMFNPDVTVPYRTSSRFWFGLHSTNPSNLSELFWDDCRIPAYIEWTVYRPLYVPDHQCLGFDVYFKPYTTVLLKLWLALPCSDQNRFICVWENDCLYEVCEEFIMITSETECITACTILNTIGDVTDLNACRTRSFVLADFTVCHVFKTPLSVTVGETFKICYKPGIDVPINYCSNTESIVSTGSFSDSSPTPNSTCKIEDVQTTQMATTPLTETTIDPANLCECPCSNLGKTTDTPLTIQERIEILKRDLTIDKKQTSNSKRKLISVSDNRQSAKGLGVFGLSILILVPVCIILMDLTSISQHFNSFFSKDIPQVDRLQSTKKGEKNYKTLPDESQNVQESSLVTRNKCLSGNFSNDSKAKSTKDVQSSDNSNTSFEQKTPGRIRPKSVLYVRPKTPENSKTKVVYKDILDIKYQPSMIASRIIANDVKSGKRNLYHNNLAYQGKDIGEEVRLRSGKTRKVEEMPWIHMF